MDFFAISGCDTSLYHSQGAATVLSLCALRHDCNKGVHLHGLRKMGTLVQLTGVA